MPPYNYLLFDAAKAESSLAIAMELSSNLQSLYKGTAEEDLAGVAPYFSPIQNNTPFANWFLREGWNKNWGILLFSNANFEDTYKHFRKFLMVQTEDREQLYFRFYDPRVLRIFLPTCDKMQIFELFGPVKIFICENEDPNFFTVFSHRNGELVTGKYEKHLLFDNLKDTIVS